MPIALKQIAYARSGDKGGSANIGIIARDPAYYDLLLKHVTSECVADLFDSLRLRNVTRYELPNLHALNFILDGALDGGGSVTLRIDAQGKALGQQLLELELNIDEELAKGACHG